MTILCNSYVLQCKYKYFIQQISIHEKPADITLSLCNLPPTQPTPLWLSSAAVNLCSDNVGSRFLLRQTWDQPSHTVTHLASRSLPHDFAVVMATAVHSYLTDLPMG